MCLDTNECIIFMNIAPHETNSVHLKLFNVVLNVL